LSRARAGAQYAVVINAWRWFWSSLLLFAVAGCQSPSPQEADPLTHTVVEQAMEVAPAAPISGEPTPPVSIAPAPTPSLPQPPAPPPAQEPARAGSAWLALESWGVLHGLGKPARVGVQAQPQYQFQTTNGTLAIKVGSRVARCDGLECWLGYAPQFIDGTPHIHWLDAEKNLQPLLRPATLAQNPRGTIVLDPGHGGIDCGTRSLYNRQVEKDYALDWALRLRTLLVGQGWSVVLTRTNDTDVSLIERIAIAERAEADFFLSLHFNSGLPNRELAGIETYCVTPAGMPSNLVRSFEDDPRQVYPNNHFDEQNVQAAFRLHRRLIQATGAPDRGVRRARFMAVLRAQNRPAVLIEGGYLSNLAEARKIASASYRQALAIAVAKAMGD
jgi:N-acetylmuramoyl-L-alanine amidase